MIQKLHLCAFKMRMVTVAFALVNRPRMGDLIVQRCKILLSATPYFHNR
jgi:hypothetical protein